MAKNTIPGLKTGGGILSKLVAVLVIGALLVVVVKYPGDAAHWVKAIAGAASDAITGVVSFFRQVGN
ncbi:MAG: hypothetical protein JWQ81_6498 [Amycolatopsis sp.]|jgi:hypothetical protein|uniref:hypothetical protein n=1 Tax=Amycolatopsis sp. TaxID=37632 RepID=UPI0026303973|nr:hypothetical protein [Amycolatopsis sp.]MCU1685759.1 hypothetical protein [Amycolatopsis sp.]